MTLRSQSRTPSRDATALSVISSVVEESLSRRETSTYEMCDSHVACHARQASDLGDNW